MGGEARWEVKGSCPHNYSRHSEGYFHDAWYDIETVLLLLLFSQYYTDVEEGSRDCVLGKPVVEQALPHYSD